MADEFRKFFKKLMEFECYASRVSRPSAIFITAHEVFSEILNDGRMIESNSNAKINRRCALRQTLTKPKKFAACTILRNGPLRSVRLNFLLGNTLVENTLALLCTFRPLDQPNFKCS